MTPHNHENLWAERLQSTFKLPLDDLVERFILHHEEFVGSDEPVTAHVNRPAGQIFLSGDLHVFVPENYEPKYAYPLIVWLCQSEQDRRGLLDLMPRVSTRNYLAVALSTVDFIGQDQLDIADCGKIADCIGEQIETLRNDYHVHGERIYLAGLDDSAPTALRLVLDHPDWFAGAITLGGHFPKSGNSLAHFRELQGKRVLMAAASRSQSFSLLDFLSTGRLLHSAGMNVSPRIYDAEDKLPQQLFSDLNEWLMAGIYESNLV